MQNQKRGLILKTIQETAQANQGIPLGQRAFQRQTGIKESEWYGRYWARWSDAIKEAGFTPNIYNQRIDTPIMLEKLIPAIRHFGKFPTFAEFKIYSKAHPGFPAVNTISNHFKVRSDLVEALTAYVSGKPELEDIATLCKCFKIPQKNNFKAIPPKLLSNLVAMGGLEPPTSAL